MRLHKALEDYIRRRKVMNVMQSKQRTWFWHYFVLIYCEYLMKVTTDGKSRNKSWFEIVHQWQRCDHKSTSAPDNLLNRSMQTRNRLPTARESTFDVFIIIFCVGFYIGYQMIVDVVGLWWSWHAREIALDIDLIRPTCPGHEYMTVDASFGGVFFL